MIITISDALANRDDYNILREPINQMLQHMNEAWERENPIDLFYKRGSITTFQQTYTSSIGFKDAFAETGDYGVAPTFNNAEGFSTIYTTKTFQGGFKISKQVLEDEAYDSVKDTASQWMTAWHRGLVKYAMKGLEGAFGKQVLFEAGGHKTKIKLMSADTTTGEITEETKNPLFSTNHNIVKTDEMSYDDVIAARQSNIFYVNDENGQGLTIGGNDPEQIAKLADIIAQVISKMENCLDDNGEITGVLGKKTIVAPNLPHLKAAINTALSEKMFDSIGINSAYEAAEAKYTPYLNALPCCVKDGKGVGFFILDKSYNDANHGLEFTERLPLAINVEQEKNPYGISYDGRQRCALNVASWRGIAYVYIGKDAPTFNSTPELQSNGEVQTKTGVQGMTALKPIASIVKPVSVVGTVKTQA